MFELLSQSKKLRNLPYTDNMLGKVEEHKPAISLSWEKKHFVPYRWPTNPISLSICICTWAKSSINNFSIIGLTISKNCVTPSMTWRLIISSWSAKDLALPIFSKRSASRFTTPSNNACKQPEIDQKTCYMERHSKPMTFSWSCDQIRS